MDWMKIDYTVVCHSYFVTTNLIGKSLLKIVQFEFGWSINLSQGGVTPNGYRRSSHTCTCTGNGTLICHAGAFGTNNATQETYLFDPTTNDFSQLETPPEMYRRFDHAVAYVEETDVLFMHGGWSGTEWNDLWILAGKELLARFTNTVPDPTSLSSSSDDSSSFSGSVAGSDTSSSFYSSETISTSDHQYLRWFKPCFSGCNHCGFCVTVDWPFDWNCPFLEKEKTKTRNH